MITVYISIGNSDDKLSQREWADFQRLMGELLDPEETGLTSAVYGAWHSRPDAPWQNACWCVQIDHESAAEAVQIALARLAEKFRQDSITWMAGETQFVRPPVAEESAR